ncbi:transposase, IS605 OrfB family protein [Scytonema sp. HK-05]|uniref:transposase n=1 Tax=Scytonema sp. HK-05 TaxID=1137095 RepID=UPI000AAD8667|nr:transposase [Scytonema sp. HK-05]BAY48502.1 transposase, IS605 OrfB family protein [Scytonema sp. HK-05]
MGNADQYKTEREQILILELPECHKCGLQMDRDENAARNVLDRALNEVGLILSARGGLGDTQPVKREAFSGWGEAIQLSLF